MTLPPGSLPGLLFPPDFLTVDSRSDELSHYSQMLPPSLPGSLTESLLGNGNCADQLWLFCSQGAYRLMEKEITWRGGYW